MEKVKVSKEVAETIEYVKSELWTDGDHWKIVRDHVLTGGEFNVSSLEPLNTIELDTLILALYIGYEVEQTPEENLIEDFNAKHYDTLGEALAYRKGIMEALSILNIKIPGVNE